MKSTSEYGGYLKIKPASGVLITINASPSTKGPLRLAMNVSLNQGASIRWTSDTATVSDLQGKQRRDFKIGTISFYNDCEPYPERTCRYPEINLIDGKLDVETKRERGRDLNIRETIIFRTSPTNRIHGTRLIHAPLMLDEDERWLTFMVPLPISEGDPDLYECILSLPLLEVNDQVMEFPPIRIVLQTQTFNEFVPFN